MPVTSVFRLTAHGAFRRQTCSSQRCCLEACSSSLSCQLASFGPGPDVHEALLLCEGGPLTVVTAYPKDTVLRLLDLHHRHGDLIPLSVTTLGARILSRLGRRIVPGLLFLAQY